MEIDPVIACGIVGNIGQLWLKEQFTDLQINIDDHQFQCHQFILCACSELFQVLLQSEVKGEVRNSVRDVTVSGISPEIFQLILKAIYKGENELNAENMMAFWYAVHELQIPVLVSTCETFISSHITLENCFGIYTSALLLEAERMIKMVHDFMAENFELFSKCQLFLLLSFKTLCEIFSSRNLKVDTQNVLVEFILKWVSYELCGNDVATLCAGDITEVPDTNNVSGQRLDHSADAINNKKGNVEVILQQPSATSQESCLQAQCLTETPVARKESLGKLLKLVRLSEASTDCLEMLADMDMIMGVKETRDMIKQAVEAHIRAQELVKNKVLPDNSIVATAMSTACELVVVFKKENTMYAYSIDRNKLFHFKVKVECYWGLVNIFTYNNCIFVTASDYYKATNMTVVTFPFSDTDIKNVTSVGSCSVIVGDFCYTFKDYGLYRTRCYDKSCDWFELVHFKKAVKSVLANVLKGNIIFYCLDENNTQVCCFNIESRIFWSILSYTSGHNIVSFIHNEQLYVLRSDGCIWNLTKYMNDSTKKPVDADITSTQNKLWSRHCQLVGAVVNAGNLLIFADLNSVKRSSKYKNTIPGVSKIRFIHLNTETKCYPLFVPTTMLVTEV